MANPNQPRAESYLIRLWRDSDHSPWRASLHKIRTGELAYFASPEELWACLLAEMGNERHRLEGTKKHQAR